MLRTILLSSALLVSGTVAFAGITAQSIAADLQAQGYTRVEVRQGPTQMKVEAIRGTEKVERVYDIDTGAVLKSEVERVRPGENTAPGVSVRNRDRDFTRAAGNSNDDSSSGRRGRDRGSDDSRSDDRRNDRGRGSDDAPGDDRGGDRGGRGRGSDDAPGDDNGGDRGRGRGSDD